MKTRSFSFTCFILTIFSFVPFSLSSKEIPKVVINTKIKTTPYLTSVLKIDRYLELHPSEENQFDRTDCIRSRNDTLFIFERRRLSIWKPDGTFIASIGKTMNGCSDIKVITEINPMSTKMDLPTDFAIVPGKNQVAIWDNFKSQVFIFNFDGQFIRKIRPDIKMVSNFTWTSNNHLIFSSPDEKQGEDYNAFFLTNLNGEIIKSVFPYDKDQSASVMVNGYFPKYKEKQYLYRLFGHCLFELKPNLEVEPYLEFWFDEYNFTLDSLRKSKGDTYAQMDLFRRENTNVIWEIQEFNDFYSIFYQLGGNEIQLYSNIIMKDGEKQYKIKHQPMSLDPLGIKYMNQYNEDTFVTVVKPSELKRNLSHTLPLVKQQLGETYKIMQQIIAEAGPNDNPVVLFLKMNDL